jgi:DNA-binding NarL/FixJ family response regulator
MKRRIVVADKDGSLPHAFSTVFSKEQFEIYYASNGKEVERLADKISPDVYIVNVDLPKISGIEVYKKLQKDSVLKNASFFFLKDETNTTQLLGYQADGVIEKPINFFKVYEAVTKGEEVIELTDLVEEDTELEGRRERLVEGIEELRGAKAAGTQESDKSHELSFEQTFKIARRQAEGEAQREIEPQPGQAPETQQMEGEAEPFLEEAFVKVEPESVIAEMERVAEPEEAVAGEQQPRKDTLKDLLKDAVQEVMGAPQTESGETASEGEEYIPPTVEGDLAEQIHRVLRDTAERLADRLSPVVTRYIEDQVRRVSLEVSEKVIRDEIERLLKESM